MISTIYSTIVIGDLVPDEPKIRMEYLHYEKKLVEKHGIVIEGWTYTSFVCLSDFKKVSDIAILYEAIRAGTCFARRLSAAEWEGRIETNRLRQQREEATDKAAEGSSAYSVVAANSYVGHDGGVGMSMYVPAPAAMTGNFGDNVGHSDAGMAFDIDFDVNAF
jgi:hypothetical protein